MYVILVGVNHKTAPVETREKLSFSEDKIKNAFSSLLDHSNIKECIIISTCNRTEIYAATKETDKAIDRVSDFLSEQSGIDIQILESYLYIYTCKRAIQHLFRVAAGMDSMVIGENEILGQVCHAYEIACKHKSSGFILNTLFQRSISVGKKVRTETDICCGIVSVGSAAVELVNKVLGNGKQNKVLLIGAGEMGEIVARHIIKNNGSSLTICNRSYDKAAILAEKIGATAAPFSDMTEHLAESSIVISCTASPDHIISADHLKSVMEKRNNKRIFLIDIAVPRDIEPQAASLENVYLRNVDDLKSIADEGLEQRKSALCDAEEIVKEKVDSFLEWLNRSSIVPVIRALHDKATTIREEELTKTLRKLGNLTDREEKLICSMAKSIVSRLIAAPISQLKEHVMTEQGHLYTQIARNLLGLSTTEEKINYASDKDRDEGKRAGTFAD
jgi:glutamyl-tRNA reductase